MQASVQEIKLTKTELFVAIWTADPSICYVSPCCAVTLPAGMYSWRASKTIGEQDGRTVMVRCCTEPGLLEELFFGHSGAADLLEKFGKLGANIALVELYEPPLIDMYAINEKGAS